MLKNSYRLTVYFSALLLAGICAKGQDAAFVKTDRGIAVRVGGAHVELAVATPTAFRLSISYQGKPAASASTFLAPGTNTDSTPWQVIHQDGLVGVAAAAGKLLIDPHTGKWKLEDAQGAPLIPLSDLGGPGTVSGERNAQVPGIKLPVAWKTGTPVQVYGCGDGSATLLQTKALTGVGNGLAVVPYYWSANGYAALAVTANDDAPASWTAAADGTSLTWHFPGPSADLYLMPAASLGAASQDYAQLSGFVPVPPRWTFGYLQSRWGWTDRAYIEATLRKFQELHIPLDAFIFDFEWYAATPDYKLPAGGTPEFKDFGWNPLLFPEPAAQLADYRRQGVHFVGIRKPRVSNSETLKMIKARGWMLEPQAKGLTSGSSTSRIPRCGPGMPNSPSRCCRTTSPDGGMTRGRAVIRRSITGTRRKWPPSRRPSRASASGRSIAPFPRGSSAWAPRCGRAT